MDLNWTGLITNFVAILFGLLIYILITNSKWGKKHEKFQYGIMLVCVLAACLFGFGLKYVVNMFF
ncbi:MAG: hypothetical protein K5644_01515 [Lachnospiraceae bacterium]|nr:hypothetical protein [Lachnospiraceae bacterium]